MFQNLTDAESNAVLSAVWEREKYLTKMVEISKETESSKAYGYWVPKLDEIRAILRKIFPAEKWRWPEVMG